MSQGSREKLVPQARAPCCAHGASCSLQGVATLCLERVLGAACPDVHKVYLCGTPSNVGCASRRISDGVTQEVTRHCLGWGIVLRYDSQ